MKGKRSWHIGWNENQTLSILDSEGNVIAFPVVPDTNPYHVALDERDARAHLIAAAPDLLAALYGLVAAYTEERNATANRDGYEGDAEQLAAVRFARAAIDKATLLPAKAEE